MKDSDLMVLDAQHEHFSHLSENVDVINALYAFSELHNPKGIMKDLCDALNADGYYSMIDRAFKLTKLQSSLARYELQVRLRLGQITTLARDEWQIAYEWAVETHKQSRAGIEFFSWQKFRSAVGAVQLTETELLTLSQELEKPVCRRTSPYIDYLHYKLGYMPYFFSKETKALYREAMRLRTKICFNSTLK